MVTSAVEHITPKKAAEYLKANVANDRKMQRSVVMQYADDIRNGRWQLNGETISFGEDGTLKNGQHRLASIVLAGKAIDVVVVRGVENSVHTYDVGKKRTLTQVASGQGVDCNSTVTAAARIVLNRFSTQKRGDIGLVEYIKQNIDELNRAYRVCCYGNGNTTKNAPCVAATYLALRTQSVPVYEAELFFRLLNDPYMTQAENYDISPVKIVEDMLDNRRGNGNGLQLQKERLEIICLGLRDFHDGKHVDTAYKLGEPFYFMDLLEKVRKDD